jgi:hypothetical protein
MLVALTGLLFLGGYALTSMVFVSLVGDSFEGNH